MTEASGTAVKALSKDREIAAGADFFNDTNTRASGIGSPI
jgi:hypothetical protein